MKRTKTIFITFALILVLTLIYMIIATFISLENLYTFSFITSAFLIFVSLIIALKKKRIFIYKDKFSKGILVVSIIILSFINVGISYIYVDKIEDTKHTTFNQFAKSNLPKDKTKKEYKQYNGEKLTILYRKSSEPGIELINKYIKDVKKDSTKIYKGVKYDPLTIKITDPETFSEDIIVNDFTGGYYYEDLKQIKIPINDVYNEVLALDTVNEFKFVLRHEYSHYISHMYRLKNNIEKDKIPIWFEEGVASFIGADNIGTPNIIVDGITPFEQLTKPEEWASNNGYEQSYKMIYLLVYNHGENVIEEILLGLKDKSFDESFKKATGKTVKDYENQLKKHFNNGWETFPQINLQKKMKGIEEERIAGIKKYIETYPDNIDAIKQLASLYSRNNNFERVSEVLKLAIEKKNDSHLWSLLAQNYLKLNEFEKAKDAFKNSLEINSDVGTNYEYLAEIYLLYDIDKSIEILQSGLDKVVYPDLLKPKIQQYKKLKDDLESGKKEAYNNFLEFNNLDENIKGALIEEVKDY
ncbi:tetratricopeptide repeat protein [Senegalia massiliensis]|uniref:tetratricopeptide repeat protein n=1 Tax=Senegalia massiliensis TaxID=1720316 RepID=UPI00103152A1|nr:collagenase [Senegalia massiliensis]